MCSVMRKQREPEPQVKALDLPLSPCLALSALLGVIWPQIPIWVGGEWESEDHSWNSDSWAASARSNGVWARKLVYFGQVSSLQS